MARMGLFADDFNIFLDVSSFSSFRRRSASSEAELLGIHEPEESRTADSLPDAVRDANQDHRSYREEFVSFSGFVAVREGAPR